MALGDLFLDYRLSIILAFIQAFAPQSLERPKTDLCLGLTCSKLPPFLRLFPRTYANTSHESHGSRWPWAYGYSKTAFECY